VLSAPPKFAPTVQPVVTLYDTLLQVAIDRGLATDPFTDPAFKVSFSHDVYPILARARAVPWLWAPAGHEGPPMAFHNEMATMPPSARGVIFNRLRTPAASPRVPGTGSGDMPHMWSDRFDADKAAAVNGTLTPHQYRIIREWKDGNSINDWQGPPRDPGGITPTGLDRAALDSCVGAPLYPGIEVSYKVRDEFKFIEAFRLDPAGIQPGDLTAQMALPWQSDFIDCSAEATPEHPEALAWWPAQRPIHVRQSPNGPRLFWARPFGGKDDGLDELTADQLVTDWFRLAMILPDGDALLEHERQDS
jgi:hypothetical protein